MLLRSLVAQRVFAPGTLESSIITIDGNDFCRLAPASRICPNLSENHSSQNIRFANAESFGPEI